MALLNEDIGIINAIEEPNEPLPEDYNTNLKEIEKYKKFKRKQIPLYIFLIWLIVFGSTTFGIPYLIWKEITFFPSWIIGCFMIYWILIYFVGERDFVERIFYKKNIEKYLTSLNIYEREVERIRAYKRKMNEYFWYDMNGHKFEEEITKLFNKYGIHAVKTKGSGDEGIDVILYDNEGKMDTIVQCKAHKSKLAPATVRELYGMMQIKGVECGLVICLGGFSNNTVDFVKDLKIRLWDVDDVINFARLTENKEDVS